MIINKLLFSGLFFLLFEICSADPGGVQILIPVYALQHKKSDFITVLKADPRVLDFYLKENKTTKTTEKDHQSLQDEKLKKFMEIMKQRREQRVKDILEKKSELLNFADNCILCAIAESDMQERQKFLNQAVDNVISTLDFVGNDNFYKIPKAREIVDILLKNKENLQSDTTNVKRFLKAFFEEKK